MATLMTRLNDYSSVTEDYFPWDQVRCGGLTLGWDDRQDYLSWFLTAAYGEHDEPYGGN